MVPNIGLEMVSIVESLHFVNKQWGGTDQDDSA
jgi:hypothetical protein